MPPELAATVMVQEQLGLALNRAARRDEAERVLLDLIKKRGQSVPGNPSNCISRGFFNLSCLGAQSYL